MPRKSPALSDKMLLIQAESALKKLVEGHDPRDFPQDFGVIHEDGKLRVWTARACMYQLKCYRVPADNPVRYIFDWALYGDWFRPDTDQYKIEYLDWLVNRSHWADAFVTKDAASIPTQGIILDAQAGCTRFLVQAAVLVRYLREFPGWVDTWNLLKDHIDPHAACVFSDRLRPAGLGFCWTSSSLHNCNHSFLADSGCSKKALFNLVNNNRQYFDKELASTDLTYNKLTSIWGGNTWSVEAQVELPDDKMFELTLVRGRRVYAGLLQQDVAAWSKRLLEHNCVSNAKAPEPVNLGAGVGHAIDEDAFFDDYDEHYDDDDYDDEEVFDVEE